MNEYKQEKKVEHFFELSLSHDTTSSRNLSVIRRQSFITHIMIYSNYLVVMSGNRLAGSD